MTRPIEQRDCGTAVYLADKKEPAWSGCSVIFMTILLIPTIFMMQLIDLLPGVRVDRSVNPFLIAGAIFLTFFPLWLGVFYCWRSARMDETICVSEAACSVFGFFGKRHVVKWEAVTEVGLNRWTGVISVKSETDVVRIGSVFRAPHEVLSYIKCKLPPHATWDERILTR